MKKYSIKRLLKGLTFCVVCVIVLSGCQDKVLNAPDRYNYRRALEALENN